MLSHEITCVVGKHKARKRVGRGRGTGQGGTAGRGTKGSRSRAGAFRFSLYEGGQTPMFRHLPKRGFNNKEFATRFMVVNVSQLERFEDGAQVGVEQLSQAGLIPGVANKVKILGDGELTKRLQVVAHRFSKSAEQKIVDCGGTATRIGNGKKPAKRKENRG
ncbi:MAG: 50S ribosomal protein L15 [Planctomycetes bacterium RBG_13_62_9]|nr:MAG: 50S ribosomal protein L15 [Planctomycetes bacterium RBG_13_62_9]